MQPQSLGWPGRAALMCVDGVSQCTPEKQVPSLRLAALAAGEAQLSTSLLALSRRAAMQRAAAARNLARLASHRPGRYPAINQ